MKYIKANLLLIACMFVGLFAMAQETDSTRSRKDTTLFVSGIVDTTVNKSDTVPKVKHSPRKAAIRSAIIPGWGQIYNKKYWKVPVVYTAIGIPTYLFFDNKKWYERTQYAYAVVISGTTNQDSLDAVHPDLKPLVDRGASTTLLNYRDEFRRNMDYSILFFLLFWALNVVDATVDAHLMDFDVSPDLSLRLKPNISNRNYGLGLTLSLKDRKTGTLFQK